MPTGAGTWTPDVDTFGGLADEDVLVGVGVDDVFVGVGVDDVRVGDALLVVGEALELLVLGVGVGVLFAVAAQIAPPTKPMSAANTIPPMTQPMIERLGSSPDGSSGPPGAPGTGT